jgi:hypothetical protein
LSVDFGTFARRLAAALMLTVLAGCLPGEPSATGTSTAAGSPAAEPTAPAPLPPPQRVADPEPVDPRFEYEGELTQGGFIRGTVPATTVSARLGEQEVEIAENGAFFAAFDRDSPRRLDLTATLQSGRTVRETLRISERAWDIERVNAARRKLRDPEAYWRQREPEYNAIVAARAIETDADGWKQDFIWPVEGRISGRFGRQRIYRGEPGSFHSGIDIAKDTGTPFVAPADGVVVLARTGFSLEGGLIIIDHGHGLNSAFLHANRIVVEEGQAVRQGQHIGDVGSTGRSTGPHLHWGLKWNDARFDPILLAGPMD